MTNKYKFAMGSRRMGGTSKLIDILEKQYPKIFKALKIKVLRLKDAKKTNGQIADYCWIDESINLMNFCKCEKCLATIGEKKE